MADGRDYGYFWNDDGSGDRTYNADSFEYWLKKFFTTGVFAGDLQVTAGGSYTVNVATGYANVRGKVKDFYDTKTFTVPSANSTYPRVDTIVVRRDDTNKIISLQYVTGTYSSQNPSATAPTRSGAIYELVLAEIYVGAGATEILQKDITDKRADKTVCGIVTGTVEEVDFSQFASQFNNYYNEFKAGKQADFETWFAGIRNTLDGDTAGNLHNLIQENKASIETNTDGVSQNRDNIQSLQTTAQNHADAISALDGRVRTNANAITAINTNLSVKSITIPSSSWSGSAPYTNAVTVNGITASENWEIVGFTPTGNTNSDKAIKEALSFIAYGTTATNKITFKCLENKPSVNLPIVIRKVGI